MERKWRNIMLVLPSIFMGLSLFGLESSPNQYKPDHAKGVFCGCDIPMLSQTPSEQRQIKEIQAMFSSLSAVIEGVGLYYWWTMLKTIPDHAREFGWLAGFHAPELASAKASEIACSKTAANSALNKIKDILSKKNINFAEALMRTVAKRARVDEYSSKAHLEYAGRLAASEAWEIAASGLSMMPVYLACQNEFTRFPNTTAAVDAFNEALQTLRSYKQHKTFAVLLPKVARFFDGVTNKIEGKIKLLKNKSNKVSEPKNHVLEILQQMCEGSMENKIIALPLSLL